MEHSFPRYFLKQSDVDTLHLTIEIKNTLHLTMGGGGGGGGGEGRRIKVMRSRVRLYRDQLPTINHQQFSK